ncbi:hypothetical protein K1719_034736 [Acacia pycnantha]|nr:hypothetical protein K1719_034736 [Acacia pycnantha]
MLVCLPSLLNLIDEAAIAEAKLMAEGSLCTSASRNSCNNNEAKVRTLGLCLLQKSDWGETMKQVVGMVVSNKMQKSVVVAVDRLFHHKLYNRYVKRTSKFMAHDENNVCNMGDRVRLDPSRPLSKPRKHLLPNVNQVV